jgi:hypothetical protein
VEHAEAAAEQRRGDRVGAAERRVVPGGRPCLGLGWLGDRAQDGLGDAQLDRCDVGGARPASSWPCSIATATAAPTAPQMDVACRPRSKNTELRSSSS